MKPPIPNIEETNREEYVSLNKLLEQFKEKYAFPYPTSFSFLPFINKMNDRVKRTNCQVTSNMLPMIKALDAKMKNNFGNYDEAIQQEIDTVTNTLLPSMFFEGEYSFISPPFKKEYVYATPSMAELYDETKWLVKMNVDGDTKNLINPLQQVAIYILNKYYKQNLNESFGDIISFKNLKTNRERHYKLKVRNDFIEIETKKTVKKLNEIELNDLLNNLHDDEKILSYLPIDSFSFSGFGIGIFTDVTELEIQSKLKDITSNADVVKPAEFLSFLKQNIRNYLNRADIEVGFADIYYEGVYERESYSLSGYSNFINLTHTIFDRHNYHIYQKAYYKKEIVLIEDLSLISNPSDAEQKLIENEIKSVILIPLFDENLKVNTIFELGSKRKYAFNRLDIARLKPIIELLRIGNNNYVRALNNKISRFIKSQFTSIHPSVEWKFEEIATQFHLRGEIQNEGIDEEIGDIVFKDVYPLYGQVDIVNSSEIRNNAIQKDLIANLQALQALLFSFNRSVNFHLLESYLVKVETCLDKLKEGYTSSLESEIYDLLNKEVHPLLDQLTKQFDQIPTAELNKYYNSLDDELGVVYKHRLDYEKSVSQLNHIISGFFAREDEKMQKTLPHYYEKYKTDGVEYNIYLGQSILKNEKFSPFHLKDFRLWQLVNICEATQLVEKIQNKLPIPLTTAQLIFVYNSPMSIRFRMDEKQFDIDGTYNVRYEILKKRIDKSYVKGTEERLSQAGMISIVYLLEKDKEEYWDYLQYLIKKDYIQEEIEDLELEKLQGAEGLKALRVRVKKNR